VKKIIILIAIIWLSGCATGDVPTAGVLTVPEKQFQDVTVPETQFQAAAVSVKEKRYKEAADAYKKISADAPSAQLAADALFELALVHAHHDNPQRDYTQATRLFSEFVKRYPDNRRADEARTWISVLKTVQELKKQNEHLNESIKELKKLDILHEERRRK